MFSHFTTAFKKSLLIIIFLFTFLWMSYSSYAIKYIYLIPNSPSRDVKKFQTFFKALKVYNWKIDGKYTSIKPSIIDFQVKYKIIKTKKSEWAWYIWPKMYTFFSKKYWNLFDKAYIKIFGKNVISKKTISIKKTVAVKKPKKWVDTYFVVTAYYSPLPWQKKYTTGSYAGDIRLNGGWIAGASWKKVHPWLIAAPKNYDFWTKIQLDWLWVWIVEDRWWAIVNAGNRWYSYDRLDIWMWHGDIGLRRALAWGKRTVKWKILNKNAQVNIHFKKLDSTKINNLSISLSKYISKKSSSSDIKIMQSLFSKAQLYSWKINGKYAYLKKSIISFQVKNKVIQNYKSHWAGYIGGKTISMLEKKYPDIFLIDKKQNLAIIDLPNKKWTKKNNSTIITQKDIKKNEVKISEKIKISKPKVQATEKKAGNKTTPNKIILQKFNISEKHKKWIDDFITVLESTLKKRTNNNKLKITSQKNKIKSNIQDFIKKWKSKKLHNQLQYLMSVL